MPWAKLDDSFYEHPKFLELLEEPDGWAAVGFWAAMLAWANGHTRKPGRTPGLVTKLAVARMDRTRGPVLAGLLVKAGLWETRGDEGWLIHNFAEFLPKPYTSEKRAEAGRKGGLARAANARQARSLESQARSLEVQAKGKQGGQANDGVGKELTVGSLKPGGMAATIAGVQLWQAHLAACSPTPPRDIQARTSDAIEKLLADGVTPTVVHRALALMRERPKYGPGLLSELAYEVQRSQGGAGRSPSTAHQRMQAAVDAGRRVQAMMDGKEPE